MNILEMVFQESFSVAKGGTIQTGMMFEVISTKYIQCGLFTAGDIKLLPAVFADKQSKASKFPRCTFTGHFYSPPLSVFVFITHSVFTCCQHPSSPFIPAPHVSACHHLEFESLFRLLGFLLTKHKAFPLHSYWLMSNAAP